MSWSPDQYRRFEAERNRPARDLLARVPHPVAHAADLGCGPGNSTELLLERFPDAAVVGVDSSPDMVAAARERLPRVRYEVADLGMWPDPGPFDLILANASLQWVPDHAALLPRLFAKLAPGGRLAVQVPDNLDEPAHRLMRETAAAGPWTATLATAAAAREERHNPDWYYRVLRALGAAAEVWRTSYYHPLAGTGAVVEWFRATGLRPYLQPLDPAEQVEFLARYSDALAAAYPAQPDGTVLLPFPRLFFVATRPG
jgi:trans-aconitate 2-methyltransferase